MTAILERVAEQQAFEELEQQLAAGQTPLKLGLMRSARLPVLAALSARLKRPILLLTQRRDRACFSLNQARFSMKTRPGARPLAVID
jgi:hypothetical protein